MNRGVHPKRARRAGTVSRHSFYGPGEINFDRALLRNFKIRETKQFQFRFEAFNPPRCRGRFSFQLRLCDQAGEARFYFLLNQPNALTDEEIGEFRGLMSKATFDMVRPHILQKSQLRVALDLMESIRRFDRASGSLVATTNSLTKWILAFTVLAVVLGLARPISLRSLHSCFSL
jgi:hypothetical protein